MTSSALTRKELAEPAVRSDALLAGLATRGALDGSLRIPNAVGPVTITADLRAGRVSAAVDIDAPREGKPQTRVNWLVRQLKTAPDGLRVDCFTLHGRGASTSELLKTVRENPAVLVDDPKREIKSFRLILSAPMGTKRGQGRGSFLTSVLDLLDGFYEDVVQDIKPWASAPPKLRPSTPAEPEPVAPASLASTSLSSQDGPETDVAAPVANVAEKPEQNDAVTVAGTSLAGVTFDAQAEASAPEAVEVT